MLESIKTRRSIRKYLDKKVPMDDVREIVECGLMAPSGKNMQGISFLVLTDEKIMNEIRHVFDRDFTYGAPMMIAVYCDEDYRFGDRDGGAAITQMLIAANELGYGSCWDSHLGKVVDSGKMDEFFTECGLKGKKIIGSVLLGYKDMEPAPKVIKENRVKYY